VASITVGGGGVCDGAGRRRCGGRGGGRPGPGSSPGRSDAAAGLGDLGCGGWTVPGRGRPPDGRSSAGRGPGGGPEACPDAGWARSDGAGRPGVVPGGGGVGGREHRRRGGRAAAVGGAGRAGRGGRLPGRQHLGCDGRPPRRPLRAVRVGRRPPGRRPHLAGGPPGGRVGLRAGPAGGRGRRPGLADVASGWWRPSQPECRPHGGRLRRRPGGAAGCVNRYGDRVEQRPTLGGGRVPAPDDVDRAVRLSVLVGSAAAALLVLVGRR
jgi:hypothetical protein